VDCDVSFGLQHSGVDFGGADVGDAVMERVEAMTLGMLLALIGLLAGLLYLIMVIGEDD